MGKKILELSSYKKPPGIPQVVASCVTLSILLAFTAVIIGGSIGLAVSFYSWIVSQ